MVEDEDVLAGPVVTMLERETKSSRTMHHLLPPIADVSPEAAFEESSDDATLDDH